MIALLVYVRLSSKRLPQKALLKIGGDVIINQVVARAKKIDADKIIVTTSSDPTDNQLAELLANTSVDVFRGDLNNVALRTIDCIKKYNIDFFIRVNGDSPLFPVDELNDSIEFIKSNKDIDLLTNICPRTFPYGYSIEIVNSKTFMHCYESFSDSEKEHITSYFYNNIEKFKVKTIMHKSNLTSKYVLTVDDEPTYNFMNRLFIDHPNIIDYGLEKIIAAYNFTSEKLHYD